MIRNHFKDEGSDRDWRKIEELEVEFGEGLSARRVEKPRDS